MPFFLTGNQTTARRGSKFSKRTTPRTHQSTGKDGNRYEEL